MTEKLKFIDLFAGIGGTRIGFTEACEEFNIECQCVFTSEWDKHAQKTYYENFGELPAHNIERISRYRRPKAFLLENMKHRRSQ